MANLRNEFAMTKIMKIMQSDVILTLIGGLAIGFGAISFVEPVNEAHVHVYDDVRAISVEQPINAS